MGEKKSLEIILLEGLKESLKEENNELKTRKEELAKDFIKILPPIKFKEVIQKVNAIVHLLSRPATLEDCVDYTFKSWLLKMPVAFATHFEKSEKNSDFITTITEFIKKEGAKIYGAHYAGICVEVSAGEAFGKVPNCDKCRFKNICKLNT